ncbi:O-antigen ligase family protein [Cytobacillus firmus]|uniref:O-antigen ligase family protein n=1 Tax=Cytobacillus firmus TaxID=1399 RepID=UPI0024946349|nr:O-antigen ligase family protein [Cytobacillus firmus]
MNYIKENNKETSLLSFLLIMSVTLGAYNINLGFSLKPYMILCVLIFMIKIYKFHIHKLMLFEVFMLLFYFYYCLTGIFAKYPLDSIRLIGAIIITLSAYFIMRYVFSCITINKLERIIAKGGIWFNVISLLLYALGAYSLNFNFWGNGIRSYGILIDRGTPRLIGLFTDPNIFAFGNFIFFFYYLTHIKGKASKIGFLLASISLVLTFSRGAFIAVLFGVFLLFLTTRLKTKVKMIILGTPMIYILISVASWLFNLDVINIVMNRFKEATTDSGSGRFDIWANGLGLFADSPFFGIGIYNYRSYSNNLFGIDHYMHNTFLEVLTESGLLGFILYLLLFAAIFYTFYKNLNKSIDTRYLIFTLISMMILMSSLSLIVNESFFLFLAIVWRYFLENNRSVRNPNHDQVFISKKSDLKKV